MKLQYVDADSVSVLVGGYIISPDGKIVLIGDCEDHDIVMSNYISVLLNQEYRYFDISKCIILLNQLHHVVYIGMKMKDMSIVYNKGVGTFDSGFGVFSIPDKIENISNIQLQICKNIIQSNQSLWGNCEKISLQYGNMENELYYTSEEFQQILNSNFDHNIKK